MAILLEVGKPETCIPWMGLLSPGGFYAGLCQLLGACAGRRGTRWKCARAGVPPPWILAEFSLFSSLDTVPSSWVAEVSAHACWGLHYLLEIRDVVSR